MNGRVLKAVEDYKKNYYGKQGNVGALYTSDYREVRDAAEERGGTSHEDVLCESIFIALEAGFMLGYRKAQRDYKKRGGAETK